MKKLLLPLFALLVAAPSLAQTAKELRQVPLSRWGIGTAQYSGITALGNDRYAVVSDKEPSDGFFLFHIEQSPTTGEVTDVRLEGFRGNPAPRVDANGISVRDCEGVAYFPQAGTVFISGEGDQQILEYAMSGVPTGRALNVPAIFGSKNIAPNYGFEALCYDTIAHRFWTTTESMLPADGRAPSAANPTGRNLLRLQAFGDDLQPAAQYAYRMDAGRSEAFGRMYIYGVPCLAPLPDGRLLVLEREVNVTAGGLQSEVVCKLFVVNPAEGHQIDSATPLATLDANLFLVKQLLASWRTHVRPFNLTFANYEGMCLGRPLADGRCTLLLISDSQGGYGRGPFHLKDFLKVVLIGD